MARPIKNNADYFSHDSSMRNDPKILYIRSKNQRWYEIYVMMLEYLASCDFFESKWDNTTKILLSGDFRIDILLLEDIINDCINVGLFIVENWKIYSNWLKKRLKSIVEKRWRDAKRKKEFSQWENKVFHTENPVFHTEKPPKDIKSHCENTQIKRKENKIKENNISSKELKPKGYWNEEVNKVIETVKRSIEECWSIYNPSKNERLRANNITKKHWEWWKFLEAKNIDIHIAIEKIIKYSLNKQYCKSITNAEEFWYNWQKILDNIRKEAIVIKQNSTNNIKNGF